MSMVSIDDVGDGGRKNVRGKRKSPDQRQTQIGAVDEVTGTSMSASFQ
jgi:hypothetical protein